MMGAFGSGMGGGLILSRADISVSSHSSRRYADLQQVKLFLQAGPHPHFDFSARVLRDRRSGVGSILQPDFCERDMT